MMLNDEIIERVANWKPATSDWPNDDGEWESLSKYRPLIERMRELPTEIREDDGWQYGDTFFGYFLYRGTPERFEGEGIYLALSRFAPIAIWGHERRGWGLGLKREGVASQRGYGGWPTLDSIYRMPDSSWQDVVTDLQSIIADSNIYLPTAEELANPIIFKLPDLFVQNANQGKSNWFEVLFNDLY